MILSSALIMSQNKKGNFLPGFPHTHRNCTYVDYRSIHGYKCKLDKRKFAELDDNCHFEEDEQNKNVNSVGRGLIPKKGKDASKKID